jgi:hypothetical protein
MKIRPMDFYTDRSDPVLGIFQSSENPCAANTITITLKSQVPIFSSCLSSATRITLSGLDIFQAWDVACTGDYQVGSGPTGIGSERERILSVLSDGKSNTAIVFSVPQTIKADEETIVTITRFNNQLGAPSAGRLGQVKVLASGATTGTDLMSSPTAWRQTLRVSRLWWTSKSISHVSAVVKVNNSMVHVEWQQHVLYM